MLEPLDASTVIISPEASLIDIDEPLEESASRFPLKFTTVAFDPLEVSRDRVLQVRSSIVNDEPLLRSNSILQFDLKSPFSFM